MKITLTLSTDERIALRRYARDIGADLETAAHTRPYRAAGLAHAYWRAGARA